MAESAATGPGDPIEVAAVAADARLLRGVNRRLVLWSGLSTLLVLAVLGVALFATVSGVLRSSSVAQLDDRASIIRRVIEHPTDGGPGGPDRPPVDFGFGRSAATLAVVVTPTGGIIGPTQIALPASIPDRDAIAAASAHANRDVREGRLGDTPIRTLTIAAVNDQGTWWIQVVQDRSAEAQTLENLLLILGLGGVVVAAVAVGFGAVYARRALVPIRESLIAQRGALRRQREFAADASHELRTPLTVIRASVEYLRRPARGTDGEAGTGEAGTGEAGARAAAARASALQDIEAEVDHLTRLVEDLLVLARSDSGAVTLEHAPVDLDDVAADAVGRLAASAAGHGIRVSLDPAPAPVLGDAARLRQLVTILVDNAIRHSPRDAEVRVGVGPGPDAGPALVRLTIDDAGPGVRPEDRDLVFERFWRAPGAPEGGTGLGLAIARWIVEHHDGTISVATSPLGGARFMVELPRREATGGAGA
jgi:signal transduction histidine kinase